MRRRSFGDLPRVDTTIAPERPTVSSEPEIDITGQAATISHSGSGSPQNMAEIISDMKVRHRKELARKDKELVAIQMDLKHQRSARMALEKQHKVELAVLARKHKDDMEAAADIATKRVDDEWDLRERAEKVRLGRELSGKSAAQAKIEGAKKQRRNELLTTLQEHNRGI